MTVWGFIGGSHYRARDGAASLLEAGADRVFATHGRLLASRSVGDHGHIRQRQDASRRGGPGRLALFHRRPYAGRDRPNAQDLARLGAASGLALSRRAADHLPPGASDLGLHGTGGPAQGPVSSRALRGRSDRPGGAAGRRRHRRARRRHSRSDACAPRSRRSWPWGRDAPCAPRSSAFPRSTVPITRSCRWWATSRPTARPASSTRSAASPTAPRPVTIPCRCRS